MSGLEPLCPPLVSRIPENLAVGMAQLGPIMTFETVGKVLLVGLCGLTHYKRLGRNTKLKLYQCAVFRIRSRNQGFSSFFLLVNGRRFFPSKGKKMKKNLDFDCFVTSL
jgi:hypothetical protein